MRRAISAALAACFLAAPALAQPEEAVLDIGGDRFAAGQSVVFAGIEGIDDLFLAGETVRVSAPPEGTAHLLGRWLRIEAPIAESLYAAGVEMTLEAPVQGDAMLFGYEIEVEAEVGGDLRVGGSEVSVSAPVAGYALLTAEHLDLDAVIAGDAVIAARRVDFGDAARIDGALTVWTDDPDDFEVPERVAPADRVTIRDIRDYEHGGMGDMIDPRPSVWAVIGSFFGGVLVVAAVAALALALMPDRVRAWRRLALARPWRALLSGFLVTSALVGSGFVLALTLVGILLIPPVLLITGFVLFAGYVLGVYVLGAGVWQGLGRTVPVHFPGRMGIAALGAVLTGIAALVPVLGWFFVLALTLWGVGALVAAMMPREPVLNRGDLV